MLGASGHIGGAVAARLRALGFDPATPGRHDALPERIGTAIYCIGATSSYRSQPLETAEAHVTHLVRLLREPSVERVVYLSSARVYGLTGEGRAAEDEPVGVRTTDPGAIYDVTKLAGEAVVLAAPVPGHCLRLTHVFPDKSGSTNFLASVLRDAVAGHVQLHSSLESAKDYVALDDVVSAVLTVCERGGAPVYNVGSGTLVTHAQLMEALREATGCSYDVDAGAPTLRYPPIDCTLMRDDLGIVPAPILPAIPALVADLLT